ncbi:MAG TPA: hypothetical protein VFB73_16035 [Chloroflexota bacterium]|nr:hypothetical protein [Chloroflexota bacterium]
MGRCRAVWFLVGLGLLLATGPRSVVLAGQPPVSDEARTWEAVLARTAEIRGLAPRATIPRTLLTREQLQARVVEQLTRAPIPERLATSAKLLTVLGLLERGTDLPGLLLQFRSGLILGQYDPETKQLYVVTATNLLGPLERVTAAHEYTHALQDQYFDLLHLRPRNAPDTDRSLAVAALLEADATFVAERYAATVLTEAEQAERRRQVRELYREVDLERIPLVVREQSYFPYTEGPRFLRRVLGDEALRGEGYGAAVNRLFADPPQTTAQILHPERYLRGQGPVPVPLGDPAAALGAGWQAVRQGTLGELDHRLLVQQYLDATVAARAAEGWAGASYALLESEEGQLAVVVRTRWDSAAEAAEWLDAYRTVVRVRYGAALTALAAPPGATQWQTPDGVLLLAADGGPAESGGAETVLALAPSAGQAAQLAERPALPLPTDLLHPRRALARAVP